MGDNTTPARDTRGRLLADRSHPNAFQAEEDDTWRLDAACIDQADLFFIDRGGSPNPAKRLCGECPVIDQCLDYALTSSLRLGIWGGLTERERRKVKIERRREAS